MEMGIVVKIHVPIQAVRGRQNRTFERRIAIAKMFSRKLILVRYTILLKKRETTHCQPIWGEDPLTFTLQSVTNVYVA
jgi:hypothetical protein